jgi:N-hydroxyarylamine O-acetyltransferase
MTGTGAAPAAVSGYLARLGLPVAPAPTAAGLAELQRRHLDALPYENLAIMLGRPDPADPVQALGRIAAGGNAGYCFHHNGAFELMLAALGFAVQSRSAQVQGRTSPELNHLALLVTFDGERWWPDVGLGEGPREPIAVVAGEVRQGPFRYEITDVRADGGWTFQHDPAGSFGALDVRADRPSGAQVDAAHRVLSMPPDGRFTRVLVVQRRDDTGADVLRGIRFQRTGGGAFTQDLTSYGAWRGALIQLGVSLTGAADGELRALHTRMLAAHVERGAVTGRRVTGGVSPAGPSGGDGQGAAAAADVEGAGG